jgi:hypothetical protein
LYAFKYFEMLFSGLSLSLGMVIDNVLSSVLWCPLRFPHKHDDRFIFTPVVCRRAHVFITLFVFVCVQWRPTHIVVKENIYYLFRDRFLLKLKDGHQFRETNSIHSINLIWIPAIRCI